MSNYIGYGITLTDAQQATIEHAIEVINPFITDGGTSRAIIYKDEEDGNDLSEQTCDNEECINAKLNELRAEYPNVVYEGWDCSGSDNEHIEICSCCCAPFNEFLTWIDNEFEHLEENCKDAEDMKQEAFVIRAVLQSYPSNDEDASGYVKHQASIGNMQPLNECRERQAKNAARVTAYAQLVIDNLTNKTK